MTHDEQMKSQELADKIQDLKLAIHKSWVEWVVIESTVIRLGDEQDELANGDYIVIPAKRWRERRKEIGL